MMLKKALFITLLLSMISSYGQITTTKIANKTEKVEEVDNTPYDGSINFLGKDAHKYIGEELYLNGKYLFEQIYGYEDFVIDYTKKNIKTKSNIYKSGNNNRSNYRDLAKKYFIVLDVISPKSTKSEYSNKNVYFLKLQEKESKDIVYYIYQYEYKNSFPFIAVKYFTKLKETEIGKEFILRGRNWISDTREMKNLKTGEPLTNFKAGENWKCIDISIEEEYYYLSLILENKEGEQVALNIDNTNHTHWAFPLELANSYEKKFGKDNWSSIVKGEVSIGMTKEMCKIAWGEPKKINKTITSHKNSEQWVY